MELGKVKGKVKEDFKEINDLNKMEDSSNGLLDFKVGFDNLANSHTENSRAIIGKILTLEQPMRGGGSDTMSRAQVGGG
jgi:hypothetical protein